MRAHQARRFPAYLRRQLAPLQCRGGWSKQIELRDMAMVVQASHQPLLPAAMNEVEPLSSRRSACRTPQESMPSTEPEQRCQPAAIRRALPRSTPLGRTSIRELQGSGPLPAPSPRTEIPARFPWPPLRARTPEGRTMDARDKILPVPRSGGRYVVELYNDIRTHQSLDKDAPVSRPVQRTGIIGSHEV